MPPSTSHLPPHTLHYQKSQGSAEVVNTDVLGYASFRFNECPTSRYPVTCFGGSFSGAAVTYSRPESATAMAPQYSSSTDEGVDTDIEDSPGQRSQQRLSYASSSSSSGVGVHNKSLSQHLSSDSSCSSSHVSSLQSNFSTFESNLDYQFESELGSSLPSCTSQGADRPTVSENVVISTSAIHPGIYVSSDNKSWCRQDPLGTGQPAGKFVNRKVTRSPVDFREGRRASDGLVAQHGAAAEGSSLHPPAAPTVAFNSQKLNETAKAKGVMELHLVQKEHQILRTLYQSSVPQEELAQRQLQHSEYRQRDVSVSDTRQQNLPKRISLPENFTFPSGQSIETDMTNPMPSTPGKAPLQQQLMQHRLLQQKRQILQKQGAFQQPSVDPTMLSRRHMLRQASYKLAQQTQIVPPLPVVGCDTEFPTIAEDCSNGTAPPPPRPPLVLEDSFQSLLEPAGSDQWQSLPGSLASCQISEPPHHWTVASSADTSLLVSGSWQTPLYTTSQPVPAWNQASLNTGKGTNTTFMSTGLQWSPCLANLSTPMQPVSESPILELTEQMDLM
ncbi:hypothetical protein AAG570_008792 [Ranatra chinensis]|uniref:Uncharacterized protein n=1 Tax=Ranatra chinensis TaxID=642074 RepID=A0ABD0YS83_9HEMI